jgi:hypothetical protein
LKRLEGERRAGAPSDRGPGPGVTAQAGRKDSVFESESESALLPSLAAIRVPPSLLSGPSCPQSLQRRHTGK